MMATWINSEWPLLFVSIYEIRKLSISLLRSILDLFLGFLLRYARLFHDFFGRFFIFTGGKRKGHAYDHYAYEEW